MSLNNEYNAPNGHGLENDFSSLEKKIKKKIKWKRCTIKKKKIPGTPRASRNPRKNPNLRHGLIFIKNLTPMWSFLCLFTVEMKLIPICNLQTFLWKGHLGFGWGGMEEEEMKGKGGGEESTLPCQKCSYRNQTLGCSCLHFPEVWKSQGVKWEPNETGEIWGLFAPQENLSGNERLQSRAERGKKWALSMGLEMIPELFRKQLMAISQPKYNHCKFTVTLAYLNLNLYLRLRSAIPLKRSLKKSFRGLLRWGTLNIYG